MIEITINSIPLSFETEDTVFSPSSIDRGTLAMLRQVRVLPEDYVLDLGCGYGPVGIYAAKIAGEARVVMSDNSESAVLLSGRNALRNGVSGIPVIKSDGFSQIPQSGFTLILSNPPYHSDFSVAKGFIEEGYKRLAPDGRMYMVTKRRDWYKNKFISVFGGVKITEDDGYFVFCAEKKPKKKVPKERSEAERPNGLSKKLRRRVKTRSAGRTPDVRQL